jgi:hypothetical protein
MLEDGVSDLCHESVTMKGSIFVDEGGEFRFKGSMKRDAPVKPLLR